MVAEEGRVPSCRPARFTILTVDKEGNPISADRVRWYYPPDAVGHVDEVDASPLTDACSEWVILEDPARPFYVAASKLGPESGVGCVYFQSGFAAEQILDWSTPRRIVLKLEMHGMVSCGR